MKKVENQLKNDFCECKRAAFTLIELLVVIAIVGILAALIMPAISAARKQTNDSKCISNLRQLGVGIYGYVTDHNGILPGPCDAGVGRILSSTLKTELIYFLQPYVGLPKPTTTPVYAEILHCPALDSVAAQKGTSWYNITLFDAYSNHDLPANKQYLSTVFGGLSAAGTTQPLRMAAISSSINPTLKDANGVAESASMIPALREVDGTLKAWPWPTASTPVHGDHENALFLDWHVGRINPADYKVP